MKAKFVIESFAQESYVLKRINEKWRERKMKLWAERDDEAHPRDKLLNMVPSGINIDQWAMFVDYRLSEKAKV